MKVVNPGDWARNALQLQLEDEKEYDEFVNGLIANKLRVSQVACVNGSQLKAHYLFIEGRQALVYVKNGE